MVKVNKIVITPLPTKYGNFYVHAFTDENDEKISIAITKGELNSNEAMMVRLHSECFTGDVLGSLRCECGEQLSTALEMIEKNGQGVILYLPQEGRGIGLLNKLKAYNLQDTGLDTVEANEALGFDPDLRDYEGASLILKSLGISKIRLLTNNPAKISQLEKYGIEVTERIPLIIIANGVNDSYLQTKKDKMGHLL